MILISKVFFSFYSTIVLLSFMDGKVTNIFSNATILLINKRIFFVILPPIKLLTLMKKIFAVILLFICSFSVLSQEINIDTSYNMQEISMFRVLWQDFKADPLHKKQKLDCYFRYSKLFLQTIYSQISAPFGYTAYYLFRKPITTRLEQFYAEKNLSNIENVGNDIINGTINKQELKNYLGSFYYNLWLYGDTSSPIIDGGVPNDYKPNLPMFIRRWLYSGVRNPRWNATYINNYSSDIVAVKTVYDNREDILTHNYGTSDTKLGMWLRWYIDKDGKWWFFYENTTRKNKNKGKLFYFGAIGFGNKGNGLQLDNRKKTRFEFSLNRQVTIDN